MAMANNAGFNFAQKNRVRRLKEKGLTNAQIAKALRASEELVSRYLKFVNKPAVGAETPAEKQRDEFGPLPGSKEWKKLSPGEKGGLTRQRNATAIEEVTVE